MSGVLNLPLTPYRRLLRCAERVERALLKLVEERSRGGERREQDVVDLLVRERLQSSSFEATLRSLLREIPEGVHIADTGELLSQSELLGQLVVFFFGSFDNLSVAMSWTVFLLAQHPEVAANLHDEMTGVLRGDPPTADRLDRLPLLDATIKESLRLFTPNPYLIRTVAAPTELGGISLRPRNRVMLSPFITHHLPEVYPDPERFMPHRWFTQKPTAFEYLPFGAGPHVCIAGLQSTMILKVFLSRLLQRWRPMVVPDRRVDRYFRQSLAPRGGLQIVLHPQDRHFESVPVRGNVHEMVVLPAPRRIGPIGIPAKAG